MSISVKNTGGGGGGINIKNGMLLSGVSKDEEIPAGMFVEKIQEVTHLSTTSDSDNLILAADLVQGNSMKVKVPNSDIVLVHDYNNYITDSIHVITTFELDADGNASNISAIDFQAFDLINVQNMFLVDNYVVLVGNSLSTSRNITISIVHIFKDSSNSIAASVVKITKLDYSALGNTGGTSYALHQIRAVPSANDPRDMLLLFNTYLSSTLSTRSYKCVLHIESDYSVSVKISTGDISDRTVQASDGHANIFSVDDYWYCVTVYSSEYTLYKLSISSDTGYIVTQKINTGETIYAPSSSYRSVYNYNTKILYVLGSNSFVPTFGAILYLYRIRIESNGTFSVIDQIRVTNSTTSSIAYQIYVSEDGKYVIVPMQNSSSYTGGSYSAAKVRLVSYTNIVGADVFPPIAVDRDTEDGYEIRATTSSVEVRLHGIVFKNITDYKAIIYSVTTHDSNAHIEKYLLSNEYLLPATTNVSGVSKTKITSNSAGEYYVPMLDQTAVSQAIKEYNDNVVDNALEGIKSQAIAHYETVPNEKSEVCNE